MVLGTYLIVAFFYLNIQICQLLMQLLLSLFQPEEEFRDKLSPIYISLNFSLDPQAPLDQHGLRPILNYETEQLIEQKVCISSNDRIMHLKCEAYSLFIFWYWS